MTRFYIENAEEFDRACRLLDKRNVPYDIDGGDRIMVAEWSRIATPFRSLGCSSCSTSTTRRYEHAAT